MIFRHGDILLKRISEKPQEIEHKLGKLEEKILPCGCHKINTNGDVFSCLKQVSEKGHRGFKTIKTQEWNKLELTKGQSGYFQVKIHAKLWRVNILIARNFIPNDLDMPEVHHINDIKIDNRIANLQWGDAKSNAVDRRRNGNQIEGSKSPMAKITEHIAQEIFESVGTLMAIAKIYGVSKKLVLLIKQKKIWKHIHINENYEPKLVLAHGETGNSHTLFSPNPEVISGALKYLENDKEYLSVLGIMELRHQEHDVLQIPQGTYEITIEREFDPFKEELRKVID